MGGRSTARGRIPYAARLLGLALLYWVLGKLGPTLRPVSTPQMLLLPPAGLAFAALVRGGDSLWPAIAIGALGLQVGAGVSLPVACCIAAGNTLVIRTAAYALRAIPSFQGSLDRVTPALALVPISLLSAAATATLGTASLQLGDGLARSEVFSTWLAGWAGDLMSILLLVPWLLNTGVRAAGRTPRTAFGGAAAASTLLTAVAALVFTQPAETFARIPRVLPCVFFLPLLWGAFVLGGVRGSTTGMVLAAIPATLGTYAGRGPLASFSPDATASLTLVHTLLAAASLVSLVWGAILSEHQRSSATLSESAAIVQAILEQTSDAIYIKDRLGRYVMINLAGARLLASSPKAAVGTDDSAYFNIEELLQIQATDQAIIKTGHPQVLDERLTMEGKLHIFHTAKAPYRDRANKVIGVIGISRDITEQRNAELSHIKLAAIVESSPDAIIGVTLDGTITSWNAAAERMFGYTREEATGRPITMIAGARQQEEQVVLLDRIRRGARIAHHETVRWRKDGTRVEIALTLSPIHDALGAIIGISGVARDLREQRRIEGALRRTEEWQRLAADAAGLGLWCWEPRQDRLTWSARCKHMHGIGEDETLNYARLLAALHPEDREATTQALTQSIQARTVYRMEHRVVWPDGNVRWLFAMGNPFYDEEGEVDRMLGVAMDITPQKQAEQERAALLAEAQATSRAKDEFLAVLSHELRTPLQAMLGWTQILKAPHVTAPTLRKGLEIIERNVRTQARLIEDLLDVSRIVAGKLHLACATVDVTSVVGLVVDSLKDAAHAKSIQLDVQLPPLGREVFGDAVRLQQVISNLLTNALKFTPSGGRVRVRLDSNDRTARVQVEDSGRGIRADFLPHVFERFRQGDSGLTRAYGGLGLGLAIVRHLVEMHGGTVKAESPGEGRGATFTVTLPLVNSGQPSPAPSSREPADSPSPRALEGKRILLVDDDADTCDLLGTVFRAAGAEVCAVQSGQAAIEQLRWFHPHLLVSDIGMPEMDGYALLRQVRAREFSGGPPVVALAVTAFASPADHEYALAQGFQAHLSKPASAEEITRMAARLMKDAA